MDQIQFTINGKQYFVGKDVDSNVTLLDFIRNRANLFGTKYMCLEAGCGACIVSVVRTPGAVPAAINACMVTILSCHNWEITTIEKIGNKLDGYHRIQKTLAEHNGSQCGHCSPGWVMTMFSLLQSKKDLSMLEIEKSFSGNICRCTGYRPILDAFKSFAKDAPKPRHINDINDIEDLHVCKKNGSVCNKSKCEDDDDDDDWCIVNDHDIEYSDRIEIILKDGRFWYKVSHIKDIFDILKVKGDDSYMLVFGNTAKGVIPIDENPRVLIDISEVKELKGSIIDQNLVIQAGTTITELMDIFEKFSKTEHNFSYLSVLYEHLNLVATTGVRNLGSIGGNLMIKHQHNEFPSDVFLLLVTVGARITILRRPNIREVYTMEKFLDVNMKGKLILNVLLPPLNDDNKIVTYKIMPRTQNAHAIVNAGFLYKYKGTSGTGLEFRIAYGGLSPSFIRAKIAEIFVLGKYIFHNKTLQTALKILEFEMVVEESPPEPSAAFRKQLALALFYKGILSLCPVKNIAPRNRSAVIKLNISRPVSKAQQDFDTKPWLYPLTEPIPKLDGLIQCAGEASYTEDQPPNPGELFAALVLSTVPRGKIVSIDPSNALKQPGAVAFYSTIDIMSGLDAEDHFGQINREVFSNGEIKYFNQPIGVVAAESKHVAEKIAKMIDVKYCDNKKLVIDVKEAKKYPERINIFREIKSTDKGNDIDRVFEGSITGYGQTHFTMETIAIITRPTEEGFEVFATSQWLAGTQEKIAKALNIPQNRVDVSLQRRLGGGFGLKIFAPILPAVACSLVSFKLNRPCRLIMPFANITQAFGKNLPFTSDFKATVDLKGRIQYLELSLYQDNGIDLNAKIQELACINHQNCYDATRWNYTNISAFTDTAKNTFFRAPGTFESVAVAEGIMERIAYELSIDPIEVRLANLDKSTASVVLEIVNTLKESSEYNTRKTQVHKFNAENRWKKKGLGTALLRYTNYVPRNFNVILSVYEGDGSIIISHGGVEMGQGINTKIIQLCAYLLKLPLSKIKVTPNTTTVAPNASTSGGSVTTEYMIMAVQNCCAELLERLSPVRAQMNNSTWEELIQKAFTMDVDLQIQEYVGKKYAQDYYLFGMAVAEVEVDILTGERQILRVDILEDVGESLNPKIDIGQIEGAFIQGMGYWTLEHLVYDPNTGELLTNRTWNYHVPQALDIPQDFRVSFRKNSYGRKIVFGSKSVSEPPICLAVAVPHAIRHAITSARLDGGVSCWFDIDGTYTLERVFMSCENNIAQYSFD